MPILVTAKQHFDQDAARARALLAHAIREAPVELRNDIMRAAWMMAVGASDAYFCDAYADLLSRTLQAKQLQPAVDLPDRLLSLKVPIISVVREAATDKWRWRMAARALIEDQSVLSLESIRKLFNQFRVAERHVDSPAPIRSGCSPDYESRPGKAGGYRPHFRIRRWPGCRFRGPGISNARDSQGVPQDEDSFAVRRGTRGTGLGDRRSGWPSRAGNRTGIVETGSPTWLAADGGWWNHEPPRLKPAVDMAVTCQVSKAFPSSPS